MSGNRHSFGGLLARRHTDEDFAMKTLDDQMPHLVPAAPNAATSTTRTTAGAIANIRAEAEAEGLYSAKHEHDACGVGFVADIKGRKSHQIVADALMCSRTSSIAAPSVPIR
jgi:glutamate synthase (NADH) large subunit (EC 1.4.1.14)